MKRLSVLLAVPVLLAGCSSTNHSAAPAATATGAAATASAGAITGTRVTGTRISTTTSTPRCHTGDLSLKIGTGGGAAGTQYENLVFTDKASHACTLYGYPGVSWVTGDSGTQVNDPFERTSTTPKKTVRLAPGGQAHALLALHNAGNYDPATCKPVTVRGFRVYPPDETASVFVSQSQTACSAKGVNLGDVSAIAAGPGDDA